jgi:hypothetical protein
MNIRRARNLEESWETAYERLILFIGTLQDTDLYHGNNLEEMFGEIVGVLNDLPARYEWTKLHLFKLCSMPTGNCPLKKRIKIAANGWKTICESFYIVADLAKDIADESIIEFKNSIRDIFTEERLLAMQDEAPFEFCVDGYDANWGTDDTDEEEEEDTGEEDTGEEEEEDTGEEDTGEEEEEDTGANTYYDNMTEMNCPMAGEAKIAG